MREAHLFTDDIRILAAFARAAPAGVQLKTDCNPDLNPDPSRPQTCFSVPFQLYKEFEQAASLVNTEMAWGAAPAFSIVALDVNDVLAPVEIHRVATSLAASVDNMRINGDHLYLTSGNDISVIDISAPNAMVEVATSTVNATDVDIQGAFMYGADVTTFRVFSIADFDAITQVGSVSPGGAVSLISVAVKGPFAYVVDSPGDQVTAATLRVIAIDSPTAPVQYATLTLTGTAECYRIIVSDTRAYILGLAQTDYNKSCLTVVDINEPDVPVVLGQLTDTALTFASGGGSDDMVLVDDKLVISGNDGMYIIDVADATNPIKLAIKKELEVNTIGDPPAPGHMDIQGRHIFVTGRGDANVDGELYIYRVGGSHCHAMVIDQLRSDKIYSDRLNAKHISATVDINAKECATGITSVSYYIQLGTVQIHWGTGTPEGAVTANVGSTFHRINGGAATSFYVKESGTGNTGWVAK